MSIIYVVMAGCYSDRYIVGVYDDKKLADFVARSPDTRIEEYTVNEHADKISQGLSPYYVKMDKNGMVINISVWSNSPFAGEEKAGEAVTYREGFYRDRVSHPWMATVMWARDSEHAVKIANERRAFLIAEDLWCKAGQCKQTYQF